MSVIPNLAFLTDNIGAGEWVVLFIVILIVVGPKRMPEVARKIGRMMDMFRRAADEFKDQLMTMDQNQNPAPPSSSASSAPSALPPTDADGVPAQDSAGNGPDPYADANPQVSDYPGNEDHVENWANMTSEQQVQPDASETEAKTDVVSKTEEPAAAATGGKDHA